MSIAIGMGALDGTRSSLRASHCGTAAVSLRHHDDDQHMPVNDSWIAGCCIRYDLPLLSANRRHFQDVADHDALTLLG
jgi:predicted nucleic acid-binding protein